MTPITSSPMPSLMGYKSCGNCCWNSNLTSKSFGSYIELLFGNLNSIRFNEVYSTHFEVTSVLQTTCHLTWPRGVEWYPHGRLFVWLSRFSLYNIKCWVGFQIQIPEGSRVENPFVISIPAFTLAAHFLFIH